MRELARCRLHLAKHRTGLKNRIHSTTRASTARHSTMSDPPQTVRRRSENDPAAVDCVPSRAGCIRVKGRQMEITKDTKVSEILREHGDIADVMEMFGIKRVGGYSFRAFITKAITVERAAKIHRVPLDEFLSTLHKAVGQTPSS